MQSLDHTLMIALSTGVDLELFSLHDTNRVYPDYATMIQGVLGFWASTSIRCEGASLSSALITGISGCVVESSFHGNPVLLRKNVRASSANTRPGMDSAMGWVLPSW